MMYNDLFEIWKNERDSDKLVKLPPDFYLQIADYIKKMGEEERMLDKKTLRASLLRGEVRNVKRMVYELMNMRYQKFVRIWAEGKKVPSDVITPQEEKIFLSSPLFAEAFQNFASNVLRGHLADVGAERMPRRVMVRFLEDVPAIIGADMKAYGPFKREDVASLPIENTKILIKQGLAEKIEA
ncbi:MAG: hypothetical protein ACPLRY_00975 [Candidatus Bathyarchaeales archaeon]